MTSPSRRATGAGRSSSWTSRSSGSPHSLSSSRPQPPVRLREALENLDTATVVTQLQAGRRLALYRDTSGRLSYRFISEPLHGVPSLLLVEYCRLSSFPARYGAGRTIKTFSLLPGEKTRIRVNTYKRSSQSVAQSSSILDSTSLDTEIEFERSVLAEQTSQDASSRSLEY